MGRSTIRVLVLAATVLCTACAGLVGSEVPRVARAFYRAFAERDGTAACGLLAPQTVHEVEKAAQEPCRTAILKEDIPRVRKVVDRERFGNQAQVEFRGETAFLAEFPGGWRLTAVACTPRPPLPYDCHVKG